MFFVKLHKSYKTVVAVCDSDILGKKFEEGIKQLDVRENFFKGEIVSEKKLIKILQFEAAEDSTFNIVGKNSIKAAKKAGIITDDEVAAVKGIPYALALL